MRSHDPERRRTGASGGIGGAALFLYRAAGRLATPLVDVALRRRARRGREDPLRRRERFGVAGIARPAGRLVWVHAASVGETIAVLPLIGRLMARGIRVVLTTGTVTSAGIAAGRLPEGALHQYAPVDLPAAVGRFLRHWRPDLALFGESELWPTTLHGLRRRGIPLVVVNARMSERSFRKWRSVTPLARALLAQVDLFLAQTPADAERLGGLGARNVAAVGNLKLDAPPPPADAGTMATLRAVRGDRPVLLAASTHPGEERVALEVHAGLRQTGTGLLTIVAPRHPDRGAEVEAKARSAGLRVARRSKGDGIGADTEVYVADTVGEMGLWYRAADLVMLGGSLVPHGGQNPIEPAKLGVPILHGPHVGNFADIYEALSRAGATRVVADAPSLRIAVTELLQDPVERKRMADEAKRCIERFTGALDRTMLALEPYLGSFGSGDGVAADKP